MTLENELTFIDKYLEYTGDLLSNELVESMKTFHHHKEITTHFHSVYVSYTVFKATQRLKLADAREITRAALLHDFYLYEWYTEKHEEYHMTYHPKESVKNIEKTFGKLSDMQRNMILSHMFPMGVERPRCVGAWLLTLADKHCASEDYTHASSKFIPVYDEINRRVSLYD
ncbi:MAG: HD domain-containing protein [Eubacterium sp.]|nr:HD domain-containing protein [Eubacterium sp.]